MYWSRCLLHCHSIACMIFAKTRQEYGWGYIVQVLQNVRGVFATFVPSHLHPANRQIYLCCLPICLLVAFVPLRILLLFCLFPKCLPDNQSVTLLLNLGLWQCVFGISMIWWFGLPFLFRHGRRVMTLIYAFLLHPYSLPWCLWHIREAHYFLLSSIHFVPKLLMLFVHGFQYQIPNRPILPAGQFPMQNSWLSYVVW